MCGLRYGRNEYATEEINKFNWENINIAYVEIIDAGEALRLVKNKLTARTGGMNIDCTDESEIETDVHSTLISQIKNYFRRMV
jgi:hypothetical protein